MLRWQVQPTPGNNSNVYQHRNGQRIRGVFIQNSNKKEHTNDTWNGVINLVDIGLCERNQIQESTYRQNKWIAIEQWLPGWGVGVVDIDLYVDLGMRLWKPSVSWSGGEYLRVHVCKKNNPLSCILKISEQNVCCIFKNMCKLFIHIHTIV